MGAIPAAALMAYAVRGRSSSLLGPSVFRGDRNRRALALTFDDGPSESTPIIMEILARHGIPATFFQCGSNVRRLPAIAREVAAAGHEIGNHSDSHPRFDFRGRRFIMDEFTRAQQSIEQAAGVRPALMRPPFGIRWFGFRRMQRELDLLGVMWTVMSGDWRLPVAGVASRLAKGASDGGILCLHDGRELRANPDIRATSEALQRVIPLLQDRGYTFETAGSLIGMP